MRLLLTTLVLFSASIIYGQEDFHLDEEYKMDSNGTIDLSSSDADVFITGSERETAHIKIDRIVKSHGLYFGSGRLSIDVDNNGGNIRITERTDGVTGVIGYYNETYTIKIEAPEGVSLKIKGDDGDYVIRNVNGAISIDADDADAELIACKGDDFRFRFDDGDLRMDTGKGSIDIDMDDGDVYIGNAQFTHIIADLDDGDLEIETSLADNGEYKIRSEDGQIVFAVIEGGGQFDIRHDDARITADSGFEIRERSESFTEIMLAKGDARVDIRADDARVRLIKR